MTKIRKKMKLEVCLPTYITGKHLLASSMNYPTCSTPTNPQPMTWQSKSDIVDGYCWRCPVTTCRKSVGIRKGSFFEKTRISFQKWLILIYWWVRQYPVTDAIEEAKVAKSTAIDIYQWLREICSAKLLTMTITLGGPGSTVQIDKSLFRHKPKVSPL